MRCQSEKNVYLRSAGTITYTVDRMYDVPEIEINFDGWYRTSVCLWPKSTKTRSNFLNLQRTPLPSPTFSTSSSNDSGFDTAFWLLNVFFLDSAKNEHCSEQLQKLFEKKH